MAGDEMEIKVDKSINLMTIGTILTFAFALGGWNMLIQSRLATTEGDIGKINTTITERVKLSNDRFRDLDGTTYRLGIVEGNVNAINNRLDNSFNRLGERLDRLAQAQAEGFSANAAELATIKTNIAVLSQRVDAMSAQKRADLFPLGPRLILPAAR